MNPARAPWWRRWWGEPGVRMPWNAAFATVLLAVLVGTLWHDREVPDAKPQASPAQAPAPAPAPAAPAQAAPPAAATATAPRPAPMVRKQPAAPQRPPAAELEKRAAQGAASSLRDDAGAAAPAAAPAPAAMQRKSLAAPPPEWTDMRITTGGRTVLVPRSQATALANAIQRWQASARRAEAPPSAADVRIELLRGSEGVTVLDLAPGEAAEVREEIARLLAR
jgi:hypothetical protein